MHQPRLRRLIVAIGFLPIVALAQSVPLTQDAYVIPGNAGNNGNGIYLQVGGAGNDQSLVQFDLTTLPAGITSANVSKATLVIFAKTVAAPGSVNIATANGSWTETGVTGQNTPSIGSAVATSIPVTSSNQYVYVDATSAVQAWVTTPPTSNNGFIITPNAGVNVQFDSKEATNTSHTAELMITLVNSGAAGATGPTGNNGTDGTAGAAGATGVGATGATGTTGNNGSAGATGAVGNTGNNGATGATGSPGPTGSNGTNGSTGPTGSNGSNGSTGATGSNGSNGSTGATGSNGSNGSTGATGLNGSNGSTGATGSNGSNGSTGATGSNGSSGSTGATGSNGTNGSTGPTGAAGSNGTNGSAGSAGATGATGGVSTTGFSSQVTIANYGPGETLNSNYYFNPSEGKAQANYLSQTSITTNMLVAPTACTTKAMYAALVVATASGSDTTTVTVYHNGAATSMTAAITSNAVGSYLANDTTHTFSVSAGDTLSIAFKESNLNPINILTISLVCQ